jgi:hypothetical protein
VTSIRTFSSLSLMTSALSVPTCTTALVTISLARSSMVSMMALCAFAELRKAPTKGRALPGVVGQAARAIVASMPETYHRPGFG